LAVAIRRVERSTPGHRLAVVGAVFTLR